MLRITQIESAKSRMLKLEGSLLEPWVGEVVAACRATSRSALHIALDLSGVTYVDAAGTRLLLDLINQGIEITACSSFVAELLQTEAQP